MQKIFIGLWLLGVCFLHTSCEKLLDKEPSDKLSNEATFADIDGARTALVGAYSSLLTTELYHVNRMVYPDLASGNLQFSKTTNVKMMDIYSFLQDAESSSMNATYSKAYNVLTNINNILTAVEKFDSTNLVVKRIKAEAKCIRALLHFDLVKLFARPYSYTPDASHDGIVVNLKPRFYNDPLPVRSTVKETYDAIIQDLREALVLFTSTNGIISNGYVQNTFNFTSAASLLAKVYLYKSDWDNAYTYADQVIRSSTYTLMTRAQYVASWTNKTPSAESIFELNLEATFAGTTLGTYYGDNGSDQQYAATDDLMNIYSATDIRGRSSLFIPKGNYYFTGKYTGVSTKATPIKVLRLSDMYLIRAEAAAHKNDLLQAGKDFDAISMRADANLTATSFSSPQQAIDAILLERRKEFAFEGEYMFDRARYKLGVRNIAFTDYRMVLPIPKASTNVNPQLKQNDDY